MKPIFNFSIIVFIVQTSTIPPTNEILMEQGYNLIKRMTKKSDILEFCEISNIIKEIDYALISQLLFVFKIDNIYE
jgi:hypothetical protein